jgi:hypothetical protein
MIKLIAPHLYNSILVITLQKNTFLGHSISRQRQLAEIDYLQS